MTRTAHGRRFGLALSGGGFRAVLYHLGVIRLLRDAGTLPQITHITSVSGGSVIGAHLVLNWDRYCGSDEEFEQVSDELLRFLQLDVRNRIVRRFPLASLLNTGRRALRRAPHRQYTRAGLLEQHYEKHLYGDTGLFNLPDSPRLYILATNLSEGSLCAFHRDGLLLQRRSGRNAEVHFEEVQMGMATVPMAVAASSAFPGFFPPLELRGRDVGAKEGDFDRHAFTDGGIYDNIGLRMFRHLQQFSTRRKDTEAFVNVVDSESFAESVHAGAQMPEHCPQRELSQRILHQGGRSSNATIEMTGSHTMQSLLTGLSDVYRNDELYRLPAFQSLTLANPDAQERLSSFIASGEQPDQYERIWLNCELATAALQRATESVCVKVGTDELDGILVSDAGASFKVRSDGRAGGLLSTALRSTDILMDRVNQLEMESFAVTPGVQFIPITRFIEPAQDPTAPHPEIQRQAALIRTDMDRFSDLEISSLVQHGYCVARQVLRENNMAPLDQLPTSAPWDPLQSRSRATKHPQVPLSNSGQALRAARTLQRSSSRRTISTLFDFRDWPTYVWIPLLAVLLFTLPYVTYQNQRTSSQQANVLSAIAATSPLYGDVLALLHNGPDKPMPQITFNEVSMIEPLNLTGYEVVSDHRIYDLREWKDEASPSSTARMHARLRFRRTEAAIDRPFLRIQMPSSEPQLRAKFLPNSRLPVHSRTQLESGGYVFETALDFSQIPIGGESTVLVNQMLPPNMASQQYECAQFRFTIAGNTGLARIWVLLPEGRKHEHFVLNRHPIDHPELVEFVEATNTVDLPTGTLATFELINPDSDYQYSCRWRWSDEEASGL